MSGTIINISSGNIFIYQNNNNIIQYSLNKITYTNINWPLTIINSGNSTIFVYILNNLIITDISQYFIVGSDNITFNGYYNTTYQTITINVIYFYNGLIQNGSGQINIQINPSYNYSTTIETLTLTSPINGYNNISIQNINILISDLINLNNFNGVICQSLFGYGASGNTINGCIVNINSKYSSYSQWIGLIAGVYSNFYSINNCRTLNGAFIINNSGGILGSYSKCSYINNCYSIGEIFNCSGGIVGSFFQSDCTISNCFSIGIISGINGGGIFGNNLGYTINPNVSVTININNCYSICSFNKTSASIGGIVGGNVYYNSGVIPTHLPIININNCYVSRLSDNYANSNYYFISQYMNSYIQTLSITNCYYNQYAKWDDTLAKQSLDNSTNAWIYPSPPTNLPYILISLENNSALSIIYSLSSDSFQYVYIGNTITLTVQCIGSLPINYIWYFNDTIIPRINTNSYTITNAQLLQDGKYTCKIFNSINSVNYDIYLNIVPSTYTVIKAQISPDTSSNILISQNNGIISYKINGITTEINSWPVMIIGIQNCLDNITYVTINTNLTLTDINQYFIMGSAQLKFIGDNIKNITLNINSSQKYNGIFQNGTSIKNGYNLCSIQEFNINGNAILNDYAGFLCQSYWNKNCTNLGTIYTCSCSIDITGNYSGGLLGAYSNSNINFCYTLGNIIGNNAGGIIGAYYNNKARCNIYNLFSMGNIIGNNTGGIFGSYATFYNSFRINNIFSTGNIIGNNSGGIIGSDVNNSQDILLILFNCYTLGNISNNAGGFIGGINQVKSNNLNLSIVFSYVCSLYNNNNGFIAPSLYDYVDLSLTYTYLTNSWSNNDASISLNLENNQSSWITYNDNIPYILQSFTGNYFDPYYNYGTPAFITSITSNQILIVGQTLTLQVLVNGTSPITYQWKYSSDNITYNNIANATINIYTLPDIQISNNGYYTCTVTNYILDQIIIYTVTSNPINVRVLSPTNPTVTQLSENVSNILGGIIITLTGTNFNINCTVFFGNVASTQITLVNSTTFNVTVPPNVAGVVNITVKNNNTDETSPVTSACLFTYQTVPTIPININAIPRNSSAYITWDINDPSQNILYYMVYCSDNTITPVQTSSNYVTFTGLTNNESYTFTVTSTNAYGTSNKSVNSNSVIPRNVPSIISIYNNDNKNYSLVGLSIINITINGTDFYSPTLSVISTTGQNILNVTNLIVVSTTQITCSIQNVYSGTFNFSILDIGGNTTFNNGYTIYNPPTISNVSPNYGSSIGGTLITITGTNLIYITQVLFDGNNISIYNFTSTTLSFRILSYNTNINPTISITAIGTTVQTNLFNFVLPPTLTSTNASNPNQLIIIGTNYNNVSVFINNIALSLNDIDPASNSTQIIINNYVYNALDKIQIQNIGGQIEFSNASSSGFGTYAQTTVTSMSTN